MMRTRLPASRGGLRARVSVFDTIWAFGSPLLALYFRDAYLLSYDGVVSVLLYCLISASFALLAFLMFRLHDGIARYFSAHDALDVVKAVICAELMTSLFFFTMTRLEGIPRSTPIIHALILAAGLITARIIARVVDESGKPSNDKTAVGGENIIMVGATQLTSLYTKLLGACAPGQRRILAILDDRPQSIGRSMAGVRILATTEQIECIIEEFAVHGLQTDRVIVGGEPDVLSDAGLKEIQRVCNRRQIKLDFVPRLIGLDELQRKPVAATVESEVIPYPNFALPRYFELRPVIGLLPGAIADPSFLSIVDFCRPGGPARRRLAGTVLAAAFRQGRPKVSAAQVPHLATAVRLARPADSGSAEDLACWTAAAPVTPRRTSTTVERAGWRHVLDRPSSAATGGSAEQPHHASPGSARHQWMGPSQWRQVSNA